MNSSRLSRILLGLIAAITLPPLGTSLARPQDVTTSTVGAGVEVTAGQIFYAESAAIPAEAYQLEKPFKSSMPGALGLQFDFFIDATLLLKAGKDRDGWTYFIPKGKAFRASHFLLGSLITPGDLVGLRVAPNGSKEWFVDLSAHYHTPTFWSRPVKAKDPQVTLVTTTDAATSASRSVSRFRYLGIVNGQIKVRDERISGGRMISEDEFFFPLGLDGRGAGAIRGAEFGYVATPQRAIFVINRPITGDLGKTPEEDEAPPAPHS